MSVKLPSGGPWQQEGSQWLEITNVIIVTIYNITLPIIILLFEVALTFLLCYIPYLAMIVVLTAIGVPIYQWIRSS